MTIQEWWSAGSPTTLVLRGSPRQVFVRRAGSGPSMTLVHGFPSSSHDWEAVAPALGAEHSLLMPDLLGFGASDKPAGHTYSIHEQADLIEALWAQEEIGSTALVAHDYGVTVAQELLARRAEGRLRVDLVAVHLLNGGLYPDLHRPEPAQLALLDPEQGPALSAALDPDLLAAVLAPTFGPSYDATAAAASMWTAISRDHVNLHELIAYITDRRTHERRWVDALEQTDAPLAFTWGMLDPISGAHMAERIRAQLPEAPFLALEDVGHWPPLEAPDRVAESILSTTG